MNRSPNLVLLEGSDDLHFALNLLYQNEYERADLIHPERWAVVRSGFEERIELKPKGGFEKLVSDLHVELTPAYLQRLAVIADADDDPNARWESVKSAIARAGVSGFGQLEGKGAVLDQPSQPVVGIWLMPGNGKQGYLEHLLAEMIDVGDQLWPYAVACVEGLSAVERRFPSARSKKAEVHTWLAWQESPGARISEAVLRQYVRTNCTAVQDFLSWFDRWLRTAPR